MVVNAIGSFNGDEKQWQKDKSYFAREQIKFDKFCAERRKLLFVITTVATKRGGGTNQQREKQMTNEKNIDCCHVNQS